MRSSIHNKTSEDSGIMGGETFTISSPEYIDIKGKKSQSSDKKSLIRNKEINSVQKILFNQKCLD